MKKIVLLLIVAAVFFATGCPKGTPVKPEVVAKIAKYEIAQLEADTKRYECAVSGENFDRKDLNYKDCSGGKKPEAARQIRNDVIYRLIRITDYNYFQFENDLYVKRATGSVLADIIDTGANLAATITNGERAKTIINASLIAFRGGRKSANLNYFREQTGEVLITKMQTSRNRVLKEILVQIRDKDVDEYPLDAALGDVIKYFYAGTLPRALQELQQDTSIAAKEAKDDVENIKGITPSPVPTESDLDIATKAQKFLNTLNANLKGADDKSADAVVKLKNIARKLEAETRISAFLTGANISAASEGQAIYNGLIKIRRDINFAENLPEKNELIKIINTAVVSEETTN